ncbi:hypothetical protein AYP92_03745 [Lactobacillus crispatus]|uniref:MobA/VirD2-like nuclease domain-containing protein n=3 Tax=Lactobacillus crispatus TaxID=47770 RepID=A0A854PRA1_9LACO|nr:relaxase/mobilization nuclease domain-containing protein [Lactobacillus crispatus]OXC22273.1 hypothetical protein AYP82_09535 [Lactobacillus crispatus]OXC40396.1 hypothetical protein AYP92_03745 [Lactobacillus crispatus]
MPATLTIKSSRSGARAIDYSSAHDGKDKAHNHNKIDRVLASSGVNCTPETGKALMQAVWRKKRTKERNMIEAYTIVQSFDPKNFDFKNPDDIKLANEMGQELVQKVVPTRLALVYTQADGTHNVIHNHIIICSIDDVTMKAMRGDQKQFKTWANANDRVLKEHGYETLKGITSHYAKSKEKITRAEIGASESRIIKDVYGNEMVQTGTVTRTEKIKERIESLLEDTSVNSWESFQEKAKNADLDVKIRYNKKHEINGLSYKLLDDPDMKRGIRAKRLGSNYMKENLNDILRQNLTKFNEEKVERDKARQRELERRKLKADRRQQNVERREEFTRRKVRQHLLPDGDGERISITDKVLFDSAHRTNSQQQSVPAEQPKPEPESKLDEGLSIFDAIGDKGYKSANKTKHGNDGSSHGAKRKTVEQELAERLRLRAEELSQQRHELNRQLARNLDFVAFSRRRASNLRKWIEKYYRKSIRFVERHFSASSNLVRKLDISVKGTSDKLDESTIQHRNRNEQPRSTTKDNSIGSTGRSRHAKIDTTLDPASKLSTNHQFNDQIDDDIPF